jgi:integrase
MLEVVMTTSTHQTRDLVRPSEVLTAEEEVALVGFLAGYGGLTREAYQLDLRQYVEWCAERRIPLFGAHRADIEGFGRRLEALGRARSTIARRLCTVACFYRYAEQEDFIAKSPATHVRRPRLDYESHATALDRNEVGAMLVAAGLGRAEDHALISLLALNGLRVSEATGANIEALGLVRGHRTLTIVRKGGKTVLIPLAPRTARAIDLAVGDAAKDHCSAAPTPNGLIATRPPAPWRASPARRASPRRSDRTLCAMHLSPPHSTPAYRCVTSKKPPATPTREPRCVTTELESPSTATPPTSSRRSSRAPPANRTPVHI